MQLINKCIRAWFRCFLFILFCQTNVDWKIRSFVRINIPVYQLKSIKYSLLLQFRVITIMIFLRYVQFTFDLVDHLIDRPFEITALALTRKFLQGLHFIAICWTNYTVVWCREILSGVIRPAIFRNYFESRNKVSNVIWKQLNFVSIACDSLKICLDLSNLRIFNNLQTYFVKKGNKTAQILYDATTYVAD